MRKVGGLFSVLVVGVALLGAASAGADETPEFNGLLDFPSITGPSAPEDYTWRVKLWEGEELRQIDAEEAGVFYEGGIKMSTITAGSASDATGTAVPTTLAVTGPNLITLTVHHREGNPAAGGAAFRYPVTSGPSFAVGNSTVEVVKPQGESPPTSAAEPAHVRVVRALGEDKLYYRPHLFLLSGDGTFGMSKVQWKSYGGATATATARASVNDCIPYCAAGHIDRPPATLKLSKLVDCNGTKIYARLEYALAGPLPKGFPRKGGYSMRPLGADGKPAC